MQNRVYNIMYMYVSMVGTYASQTRAGVFFSPKNTAFQA